MSRIRLRQEGIPNHKLQKNLDVNGFAINDGLDGEGLYLKDWAGNPQMRAGLNISNPAHTLTVYDADYPYIQFVNSQTGSGQNDGLVIGMEQGSAAYIVQREAAPLIFRTSDTDRLTIESGGNVGIGVADPDTTLEVWSASTQLKLSNSDTSYATLDVDISSNASITAAGSGNVELYGNNIVFGTNAGGNHSAFSISSGGGKWSTATGPALIDANGDIDLDSETGDILINFASGKDIIITENAGTYIPTSGNHVTNKKYVDDKTKYHYHFIKVGFNYSYIGGTRVFLPTPGAESGRELSLASGGPETFTWICPYDGTLERVQARSEEVCGSSIIGFWHTANQVEIAGPLPTSEVTVNMSAIDTTYEFDFTGETNTFSKGDIIMFSFDPANDANDVHFMITLKLDVTT